MKPRNLIPVLLSVCLAGTAGANEVNFTYVDLGTLPGGSSSVAYGMNDAQQIVGWATIPGCLTMNGLQCRRAYVWDDGVMTSLPMLPGDEDGFARGINNNGLIVGTSESDVLFGSGTYHAVSWSGGLVSALPDLGNGTSFAHDVNDSGTIAGHSVNSMTSRDSAVTWSGGLVTNLGGSELGHDYSRLQGINAAGQTVGFGWNLFSPNDSLAFNGAEWLTIGGTDGPFQNSEASDVNDSGMAVGLQAFPSGSWHAAGWQLGVKGAIDFGTLPGLDTGEMYAVNNQGLAVGASYDGAMPGSNRAVLWDGTQLLDLNDFLPAGSGVLLYEARDINENGDIAGTAVAGGQFRAFLLRRESAWTAYGQGASPANSVSLDGVGSSSIGQTLDVVASNVTGVITAYIISLGADNYPLLGGVGLVDATSIVLFRFRQVNAGESVLKLNFPNDPTLVGAAIFAQTASVVTLDPDVWELSNGLEIPICE
ncbi:MAG: putative membrane protein [Planctomycetota bacterium]|jgi:uncharacterized membrane protein